jgi:hypothetical protein
MPGEKLYLKFCVTQILLLPFSLMVFSHRYSVTKRWHPSGTAFQSRSLPSGLRKHGRWRKRTSHPVWTLDKETRGGGVFFPRLDLSDIHRLWTDVESGLHLETRLRCRAIVRKNVFSQQLAAKASSCRQGTWYENLFPACHRSDFNFSIRRGRPSRIVGNKFKVWWNWNQRFR